MADRPDAGERLRAAAEAYVPDRERMLARVRQGVAASRPQPRRTRVLAAVAAALRVAVRALRRRPRGGPVRTRPR
jgi:hypothetical protein